MHIQDTTSNISLLIKCLVLYHHHTFCALVIFKNNSRHASTILYEYYIIIQISELGKFNFFEPHIDSISVI